MDIYQFEVFKNGKPLGLMSQAEVTELLGLSPVVPPVVQNNPTKPTIAPLYGAPRTLLGNAKDGKPVYALTGINYLGLLIDDVPDTIALRGTDLDYTPLPGIKKPTGFPTPWFGTNAPEGIAIPTGYTMEFFDAAKKEPLFKRIEEGDTKAVNSTTPASGPPLNSFKTGKDYVLR